MLSEATLSTTIPAPLATLVASLATLVAPLATLVAPLFAYVASAAVIAAAGAGTVDFIGVKVKGTTSHSPESTRSKAGRFLPVFTHSHVTRTSTWEASGDKREDDNEDDDEDEEE